MTEDIATKEVTWQWHHVTVAMVTRWDRSTL